jgi:hypothetical protein
MEAGAPGESLIQPTIPPGTDAVVVLMRRAANVLGTPARISINFAYKKEKERESENPDDKRQS